MSAKASRSAARLSGRVTPLARPTAAASAITAAIRARPSGSARITPIGSPVAVVTADSPTRNTNLRQIAAVTSSTASASTPAPLSAATMSATATLGPSGMQAELDTLVGAVMGDHAGLGDGGGDIGDAARHPRRPEPVGEQALGLDPVLQRDHRRFGPDRRQQRPAGRAGVGQLDRDEGDVGRAPVRPQARGIVADHDFVKIEVAERAPDPEPAGAERFEVRTARDEAHIVSRRGEAAPEIAADPAGSHHDHAHGNLRLLQFSESRALTRAKALSHHPCAAG